MFFVNYNEAGNIVSYTEGEDASHNVAPADCKTLTFASAVPGLINSNGACLMKVDTKKKELVLINPVTIPKPIG